MAYIAADPHCAGRDGDAATQPVTAHSILWLGDAGHAREWLARLERLPLCRTLLRRPITGFADFPASQIDLVLLDVTSGPSAGVPELVRSLEVWPVIALTTRELEHRGVAAVRAGAQSFLCSDGDTAPDALPALFGHAIERHRLVERLSGADAHVLSILKCINDGVIVVDASGSVIDVNPAACSILGLPPRQQPPAGWAAGFCAVAADGITRLAPDELPLARASRGRKFSGLIAVHRVPGQPDLMLSLNGQGVYDGEGELAGGVVTFRDVTDVTRRTMELEKRAQYDELTLLPNRSLFLHQLEKAAGRARRKGTSIAVLFIDLDRFKSVNDTLGHDAGDELLRRVGERLTRNLRIGDLAGRWGGDEFVVCLEDFGASENAAAAAQKLVLALSERYDLRASEVYATPSIGIALYPDAGGNPEQLVKAADLAMYQAKKRGGGRFHFFSDALNTHIAQREELELGLRHALVRRELILHYQPRIEVGSGRLIGLEALLRWQHPRYGLLPPGRFLPLLESSGLIHSAGEWVLETGCRQLAAWQRRFELPDLALAINLSPQQLLHRRLVDIVARALADNALDPGCLELEVDENGIRPGRAAEQQTLEDLRSLGVRLSLDHFGTRDVSFRSLDTGVIDAFVLDISLIQDVTENDAHQRIVRAAIAMARGLDLEVAAEGVETVAQLEFLKDCDCDLAQGFLIGRPMQAEKIAALLQRSMTGAAPL
ncbi:MAG TPA: EAL domain-containing protein [Woeseiaceae bacterium]